MFLAIARYMNSGNPTINSIILDGLKSISPCINNDNIMPNVIHPKKKSKLSPRIKNSLMTMVIGQELLRKLMYVIQ